MHGKPLSMGRNVLFVFFGTHVAPVNSVDNGQGQHDDSGGRHVAQDLGGDGVLSPKGANQQPYKHLNAAGTHDLDEPFVD